MILVFSEKTDYTTNTVLEWLRDAGHTFERINPEDKIHIHSLELAPEPDFVLETTGPGGHRIIRYKEVQAVWYRRGEINFVYDSHQETGLDTYLKKELTTLDIFIHQLLNAKPHINSFLHHDVNKLYNLWIASQVGLPIPATHIFSEKESLQKGAGSLITKPLWHGGFRWNESFYTGSFTERVEAEKLSDTFLPSLFQQEIIKKYELRIFILDGEFYPTAIFSQANRQTEVDFRKYDKAMPNRVVPYILPAETEQKLAAFMKEIRINCGSVDMIVDEEDTHYFLEINPVGQFEQVSVPGNYYLEKRIAAYLTKRPA